jgi:hypothetical protein
MQMIIDFIHKFNSEISNNYKINCIVNAQNLWDFSLKMAEKMFFFGDDAVIYAQKINNIDRLHGFEKALDEIKKDFVKQNVQLNEKEALSIYNEIHFYTLKNISTKNDKDYYV